MIFRERLLGNLLTFQRGFDITKAEQSPGDIPIVSSSGISSFHSEAKVRCPGVVIGRKGSLGTVHFLSRDFWPHDTTLWIKDFKGNDPRFLSYFLSTLHLEIFDTGSSNPTLNRNHVHKIKVLAPEPEVQRKIAAVLTAYDDLIANNQRRIAVLESMAEEIYREWFVRMRFPGYESSSFVQGLPSGWTQRSVSEIADVNSRSIRKDSETELIHYVDISAVDTNELSEPAEISLRDAPGRARRLVSHGDVLWSSVRPGNKAYCVVIRPPENLVASTGFAVLSPKPGTPYTYFHKAVTTQNFTDQMVAVAKGSAYPATSFDDFARAKIIWPENKLLEAFHSRLSPMYEQVAAMRKANTLLRQTRDALLPRLISGKLRVDQLNIQTPPSMRAETAQAA